MSEGRKRWLDRVWPEGSCMVPLGLFLVLLPVGWLLDELIGPWHLIYVVWAVVCVILWRAGRAKQGGEK
jgi:hypothetical protein